MKKLFLLGALIFLPLLSLAGGGICPANDPNFCACFAESAISNCLKNGPRHHIPPKTCNQTNIFSHLRGVSDGDIPHFCHTYSYMFPVNASPQDCVDGIRHMQQQHC